MAAVPREEHDPYLEYEDHWQAAEAMLDLNPTSSVAMMVSPNDMKEVEESLRKNDQWEMLLSCDEQLDQLYEDTERLSESQTPADSNVNTEQFQSSRSHVSQSSTEEDLDELVELVWKQERSDGTTTTSHTTYMSLPPKAELDVSGHHYWLNGIVGRTTYQQTLPSFTHAGYPAHETPQCSCPVCRVRPQRSRKTSIVLSHTFGRAGVCDYSQCERRCNCFIDLDPSLTAKRKLNETFLVVRDAKRTRLAEQRQADELAHRRSIMATSITAALNAPRPSLTLESDLKAARSDLGFPGGGGWHRDPVTQTSHSIPVARSSDGKMIVGRAIPPVERTLFEDQQWHGPMTPSGGFALPPRQPNTDNRLDGQYASDELASTNAMDTKICQPCHDEPHKNVPCGAPTAQLEPRYTRVRQSGRSGRVGHLHIGTSRISGAGNGLFTRTKIQSGTPIISMEEPIAFRSHKAADEWLASRNLPQDATVARHCNLIFSDATLTSMGQAKQTLWYSANHQPFDNANAEWSMHNGEPILRAIREIAAGQEITYAYGEGHRDMKDSYLFPTARHNVVAMMATTFMMQQHARRTIRQIYRPILLLSLGMLTGAVGSAYPTFALHATGMAVATAVVLEIAHCILHDARPNRPSPQVCKSRPNPRNRHAAWQVHQAARRAESERLRNRRAQATSTEIPEVQPPPSMIGAAHAFGDEVQLMAEGPHMAMAGRSTHGDDSNNTYMWVDTMAPYGIVNTPDAIIRVQDANPNTAVEAVGGRVKVEAIVTIGFWVILNDGRFRWVEIPDVQYIPTAPISLYPVQSAEDELNIKHNFNDDQCALTFSDGWRAPFKKVNRNGSRAGYALKVWYGQSPPSEQQSNDKAPAMAATAHTATQPPQRTVWRRLACPAEKTWSNIHSAVTGVGLSGQPASVRTDADDLLLLKGRMRAQAFKKHEGGRDKDLLPLEKVYMDFAGPICASIFHGFRHYCGVVDGATGWAKIMPCHGETAEAATTVLAAFLTEARAIMRDVRPQSDLRIMVVRTDQGAAFTSEAFVDFVERKVKAQWKPACTYTPQQNSTVERMWQTAFGHARVLLIMAKLPPIFHTYAIQTATFINNRLPSEWRKGLSPYMILTGGGKADLSHLRVFGCTAFAYIQPDARDTFSNADTHGPKLCDRAAQGIYLGPDARSPGHVIYLTGRKRCVITARHVKFDENIIPGTPAGGITRWMQSAPPAEAISKTAAGAPLRERETSAHDMLPTDDGTERATQGAEGVVHNRSDTAQPAAMPTPQQHATEIQGDMVQRPPSEDVIMEETARPETSREVQDVQMADAGHIHQQVLRPGHDNPSSKNYVRTHPKRTIEKKTDRYAPPDHRIRPAYKDPTSATRAMAAQNFMVLSLLGRPSHPLHWYQPSAGYAAIVRTTSEHGDVSVPSSYRDAMRSQHKEQWKDAMSHEISGLMEREVFSPIRKDQMPQGANLMNCHFVYALKRTASGMISKWKARLVADGNTQKQECGDFGPSIFSTVVKLCTVRLILVLACKDDHDLSSVDVRQAYLYAKVDEQLYMRMPPTLPRHDAKGNELVVKLNRSLYGLRQAARQWNKLLVSFLKQWGFVQSTIDCCMFIYEGEGNSIIRLAIWVDDLVISASSPAIRTQFVKDLSTTFDVEDNGDLQWILGVQVQRKRKTRELSLSQNQYIKDILARHAPQVNMTRKVDTPLAPEETLSREQCPAEGSPEKQAMKTKHTEYMQVVGALLWLASFTRPDLTYAASVLARFVSNPGGPHYTAMQRTLAYLYHSATHGLLFKPDKCDLIVYSDADWSTKYSTSGGICYVHGCPVHWHTRLQRSVSHSTAEAEYIAASMAARETVFLRELLVDLHVSTKQTTEMKLDSKSAIDMAFDPVAFKKTKHILRDAEYLRDLVARETFKPTHVASADQRADTFTKQLPRMPFLAIRDHLVSDVH